MLIIKKREKSEPAIFPVPFRGQEITLTVRPSDPDEIQKIIKKHTRYIIGVHPASKAAVRIPESDNTAIGKDIIDLLLVEFSGIAGEDGKALPVTRENKILVASLKLEDGEDGPVYLSDAIQKKAQELAEIVSVEAKEEIKNSGGAPASV